MTLVRNICIILDNSVFADVSPGACVSFYRQCIDEIKAMSSLDSFFTRYFVVALLDGAAHVYLNSIPGPEFHSSVVSKVKFGEKGKFDLNRCLYLAKTVLLSPDGSHDIIVLSVSPVLKDGLDCERIASDLKMSKIRVNYISQCGEIHVLKRLCLSTGGSTVIIDKNVDIVTGVRRLFSQPEDPKLVNVGFASKFALGNTVMMPSSMKVLLHDGNVFPCPKCSYLLRNAPSECSQCGLLNFAKSDDLLCASAQRTAATFRKDVKKFKCKCAVCELEKEIGLSCGKCANMYCDKCANVHEIYALPCSLCISN